MNLSVAVIVALFYICPKLEYANTIETVKTMFLEQKLDNFDEKNDKTWNMPYMVTEKYFKDGGPMFIYVGNEDGIEPEYIAYGLFSDIASEHNGILFHTEHRFYGKSQTTSDYSMENLQYLSAKQGLADLAHFIRHQRETDPRLAESKIFMAGCSYAGSLVVWFNRIYPGLADGIWSLSGPILAKVEFSEYYEIVGTTIKELGSQQCYQRIKNGIAKLEKMFDSDRADEAQKALKLCDTFDFKNKLDQWTVFREIAHLFSQIIILPTMVGEDIHARCEWLMEQEDDFSAITAFYQEKYSKDKCADRNYYSDVYHNNRTDYAPRVWMYQMCNEFGFFQTSASYTQPFGTKHSIDGDLQLCFDVFGPTYTRDFIEKSIDKTNKFFGGLKGRMTNVYMTHCATDPWSALAPPEGDDVSIVPKCSHCYHIYSISENDTAEMRASKERVFQFARKCLA